MIINQLSKEFLNIPFDKERLMNITKVFERNSEPRFFFNGDNDRFYVRQSLKVEFVKEDGLSLGFPSESGSFSICEFVAIDHDENDKCLELQDIIDDYIEPQNHCSPRLLRFLDYRVNEDEFDSDECYWNCIAENTRTCSEYLLDGSAELVHKFHFNGDKLYRVPQDVGEPLYFVTIQETHDKSSVDYDFLTSVDSSMSDREAVKFAVNEDKERQAAKQAELDLNKRLVSLYNKYNC